MDITARAGGNGSHGRDGSVALKNVQKTFRVGGVDFAALNGVSLTIDRGELVAITGKSGSGKSTILNIITGIDHASAGSVVVAGRSLESMSEAKLSAFRGRTIGVVFQFFQLLPTLTVAENVIMPMDFCDLYPKSVRRERALSLLELVGIREQADKLPSALSGGQQQRAAIARALANDADILVADEPTGNLDTATAESIFSLFRDLAAQGKTVIVVTHEKELGRYFDRNITIRDGMIVSDGIAAAVGGGIR